MGFGLYASAYPVVKCKVRICWCCTSTSSELATRSQELPSLQLYTAPDVAEGTEASVHAAKLKTNSALSLLDSLMQFLLHQVASLSNPSNFC